MYNRDDQRVRYISVSREDFRRTEQSKLLQSQAEPIRPRLEQDLTDLGLMEWTRTEINRANLSLRGARI